MFGHCKNLPFLICETEKAEWNHGSLEADELAAVNTTIEECTCLPQVCVLSGAKDTHWKI